MGSPLRADLEVPQTEELSQTLAFPRQNPRDLSLLCFETDTIKISTPPSGKRRIILQLDYNENIPCRLLCPAYEGGEKIYTRRSVTGFLWQGSEYTARRTISSET